jgi:multicomponent Na+:H+ antiporter subunit B
LKWIGFVLIVLFTLLLFYAESDMAAYGDVSAPPNLHVSPDYVQGSMKDTETPDIVTAVLADYRGYDTLGETTVIFTAGLICYMLLGGWKRNDN